METVDPAENEQVDKLATAAAAAEEKAAAEKAEEEEEAKRRRAEQATKFQMQIDKIEEERGQLSDNTHPEVSRKRRVIRICGWKTRGMNSRCSACSSLTMRILRLDDILITPDALLFFLFVADSCS